VTETSWFERMRLGFRKTSDRLGDNLTGLITKSTLDEATLDEIEEALIASDLGPATATAVRDRLAGERFERGLTDEAVRAVVAEELEKILAPVAEPLEIDAFPRPQVILVVGVNGSGKTTTIAKLAHLFQEQDYSVLLAAGDTFRAAAIEQLRIWADRAGVPIVTGPEGSDSSAIVFDAVKKATAEGIDVLIVDTAGRLQNKKDLMDELAKIRRTLGRLNPASPHDVVLVLDATTGQNALSQIEVFRDVAGVSSYGLPIHAIGVGEGMDDLRPFDAAQAARAIAGAAA
jgi:fused signal recognition particle receptor